MTVYIKKGKLRLWLYCPLTLSGIVLKRCVKNAQRKAVKKTSGREKKENEADGTPSKISAVDFSAFDGTVKTIVRELKAAKKHFGNIVLLSVAAADGTEVVIKL